MATAKKAKAAAPAAKKAPAAQKAIKEAMNKTQLIAHLAATSGVEPKGVKAVLAALEGTIKASVSKKGLGSFTMPGLLKVDVQKVPAKPARKGINPFTKEPTTFKAKPASLKVKVRPMKALKDAAAA